MIIIDTGWMTGPTDSSAVAEFLDKVLVEIQTDSGSVRSPNEAIYFLRRDGARPVLEIDIPFYGEEVEAESLEALVESMLEQLREYARTNGEPFDDKFPRRVTAITEEKSDSFRRLGVYVIRPEAIR